MSRTSHGRRATNPSGPGTAQSLARLADVGPGTLYRHFPTREALVLEVYCRELQRLLDRAPELLRTGPPLVALRTWLASLARYIQLRPVVGDALVAANQHDAGVYEPLRQALRALLAAAEADGSIRAGLHPEDLLLLTSTVRRVPAGAAGDEQTERILGLILEGLGGGTRPTGPVSANYQSSSR